MSGGRIVFGAPDIGGLRRDGFLPVDMHVHTRSSDAAPTARQVLAQARWRGIGVAITDHNEVRGVVEAFERPPGVTVVPGIELDCAEGPHLLLYFYSLHDLVDFYDRHVRPRRAGRQYMTSCPSAAGILAAAEGYACLVVAAHPFGYFGLDRGVLRCDARGLLPGIAARLTGVEAICGAMSERVNRMAATYAETHEVPATGGSDAHVLRSIGSVVTGVRADSLEELLDGVRRGDGIVVGSSAGPLARGMAAGVIACHYVPYAATALRIRIGGAGGRSRRRH